MLLLTSSFYESYSQNVSADRLPANFSYPPSVLTFLVLNQKITFIELIAARQFHRL